MVNNTATVAHDVHTAEITQMVHTIIGYNNKNEIATKKTKFQAIFEGRGQKRENNSLHYTFTHSAPAMI